MEQAAEEAGVSYTWQATAWSDTEAFCWFLDEVWAPFKEKVLGSRRALLVLDRNGKVHNSEECKRSAAKSGTLLWFGKANFSHRWQGVDWGPGKVVKDLNRAEFEDVWLADRFNRHRYEKRKLPYPEKRLAFVRMSGAAWRKFSGPEYRTFRHQAMLRTGNLITADGSADSEIRPDGLPPCRPPPGRYRD